MSCNYVNGACSLSLVDGQLLPLSWPLAYSSSVSAPINRQWTADHDQLQLSDIACRGAGQHHSTLHAADLQETPMRVFARPSSPSSAKCRELTLCSRKAALTSDVSLRLLLPLCTRSTSSLAMRKRFLTRTHAGHCRPCDGSSSLWMALTAATMQHIACRF